MAALVKWAGGVPRRLNALADAALFEAHLASRVSATAADVERAALELELPQPEGVTAPAAAAKEAPRKPSAPEPQAPAARERVDDDVRARRARPSRPRSRAAPAPVSDLEAIFAEEEAPLELEEVVAIGTDPLRAQAGASVALLGDDSFGPDPFGAAPRPTRPSRSSAKAATSPAASRSRCANEDSAGDLDDLFADLVKD